ncbi:hypothetical protein FNV43_RR13071 [Rhamnella rubrinervis]|uniref:Zinc knuckle CX2CX4HX4C domain-containing protein n=1 Tax=Rhamnella rubrinervis TaxID=2594499 RepID=A0A8K0MDK0_9ROSA|nr:hypothetical protein FNV43_RR13071 [Rhamnella rubrinervis]
MPIWIQIRELPFEWCSIFVLTKLGSKIGKVLEVKPGFSGMSASNVSHVRVSMLLTNLILPGFGAMLKGKDPLWLNLKYERLPHLYYNCGVIGYEAKNCKLSSRVFSSMFLSNPNMCPFGDWLRVDLRLKTLDVIQKFFLEKSTNFIHQTQSEGLAIIPYITSKDLDPYCSPPILLEPGPCFKSPSLSSEQIKNALGRICKQPHLNNFFAHYQAIMNDSLDPNNMHELHGTAPGLLLSTNAVDSAVAMSEISHVEDVARKSRKIISLNKKRDKRYSPYKGNWMLRKKYVGVTDDALLDDPVTETYSLMLKGVMAAHNQPSKSQ